MTAPWLYDDAALVNPPSIKAGRGPAITLEEERRYRAEAVGHMQLIAKALAGKGEDLPLKSPAAVVAVAATLLHRFYMHQPFQEFRRLHMATACLFLAMKTSRVFEVTRLAHNMQITKLAEKSFKTAKLHVKPDTAAFRQHVAEVLYCERALLATVHFDLQIVTPHELIVDYATMMDKHIPSQAIRDDITRDALKLANSCFAADLCLRYRAELIAVACIELAANQRSPPAPIADAPTGQAWYRVTTVTLDDADKPTKPVLADVTARLQAFIHAEDAVLKDEQAALQPKPGGSGGGPVTGRLNGAGGGR